MWLPFVDACNNSGQTPSEVLRQCISSYLENHEGNPNNGGPDPAAEDSNP